MDRHAMLSNFYLELRTRCRWRLSLLKGDAVGNEAFNERGAHRARRRVETTTHRQNGPLVRKAKGSLRHHLCSLGIAGVAARHLDKDSTLWRVLGLHADVHAEKRLGAHFGRRALAGAGQTPGLDHLLPLRSRRAHPGHFLGHLLVGGDAHLSVCERRTVAEQPRALPNHARVDASHPERGDPAANFRVELCPDKVRVHRARPISRPATE
mmetsp:Transcript_2083/g.6418  ORF Transcript_2083/g.6418 Transcript_2083/m.6418 type:complete len:210 (-) Transcript_2083:370-999(-)